MLLKKYRLKINFVNKDAMHVSKQHNHRAIKQKLCLFLQYEHYHSIKEQSIFFSNEKVRYYNSNYPAVTT